MDTQTHVIITLIALALLVINIWRGRHDIELDSVQALRSLHAQYSRVSNRVIVWGVLANVIAWTFVYFISQY